MASGPSTKVPAVSVSLPCNDIDRTTGDYHRPYLAASEQKTVALIDKLEPRNLAAIRLQAPTTANN